MKKKIFLLFIVPAIVIASVFSGCGQKENQVSGVKIVSTIFPQYDFARAITGDKGSLKMLIPPGGEAHTYEPTPQDIISIQEADVFLYIGGESDAWVDNILDSVNTSKTKVVRLIDYVDTLQEETAEGMQEEKHSDEAGDEPETDEHIWTSPKNAVKMVNAISDAICRADSQNDKYYKENTQSYVSKLDELDKSFSEIVKNGKRNEIIFGDRFPLIYFTKEYGLKYYAAFPGCASETEPSASTIAFLTDKVKEDKIPVVFKIELSSSAVADTIAGETGAEVLTFYSCHNLSKEQFNNGETYLSMMTDNLTALKTALN